MHDHTGVHVGVEVLAANQGLHPGKSQVEVGFLCGAPAPETGTIVGSAQKAVGKEIQLIAKRFAQRIATTLRSVERIDATAASR